MSYVLIRPSNPPKQRKSEEKLDNQTTNPGMEQPRDARLPIYQNQD